VYDWLYEMSGRGTAHNTQQEEDPVADVHVVYNGRNQDISFEDLFTAERRAAVGIAGDQALDSSNVTESQLKQALSQYFDVGVGEFNDHFVELNPNKNATVRPNTPFGA
jgi:predicted nucleotidyltransferase